MKKLFTLLSLAALSVTGYAQSCISGFGYYMPITINNPNATPLVNHQVNVTVNTASLVSAGHMQSDGDDIRFVNSVGCCDVLGFVIESGINTSSTELIVKVPSVPANGSATIYMFYGNPSAANGENPDLTFDLYEDFNAAPYHFTQDACGSGTNTQNAGTVTFSWGSQAAWVSDSTFSLSYVYTAEANVTAVSGNWPMLHFLKTTNQCGYGMLASGPLSPRLSETGTSTGFCQGHNWASGIMSASTGVGRWSTTWISTGNIIGEYPTTGLITSTSTTHQKDASLKLVLGGCSSGSGSYTLDWVRVRKYAAVAPTATVGAEAVPAGNPAPGFLGADQTVCVGQFVTFNVSSFGFVTHLWSTGATTSSITVTNPGAYWYQSTNMLGCTVADTVQVFNDPSASAGTTTAPAFVCTGSTASLSTSGTVGSVAWYQWDGSVYTSIGSASSVTTPVLSPAGTYSFVAIATGTCDADTSAMIVITADPAPVSGTVSVNSDICLNSTVTLSTSGNTGSVDWYSYDGVNYTNIASNTTSFTTAPMSVAGTYSFVAIATNSCGSDTSVFATTTVHNPPVAGTSSTTASNLCAYDSVLFLNSGSGTYDWYFDFNNSGNFQYFGTGNPFNPGAPSNQDTGTYTFYAVISDMYCPADTSNSFTVVVMESPLVSLGPDTASCMSLVLDAGNPGSTYMWSTSATTQTIVVSSSGTYSVTATGSNGCSTSDAIVVTINSAIATLSASNNTVCLSDGAVTLTGSPSGGTYMGPGVSGNMFTPMTAGNGTHTVSYVYTDINGCVDTATTIVTVNPCTGIDEVVLSNAVSVYPNPNNGQFAINVNSNVGEMIIEVTDISGRVVYSAIENNVTAGQTIPVNMEDQANGMYLLRVTAAGQQSTVPVSITK